jgi:hypothetical protein
MGDDVQKFRKQLNTFQRLPLRRIKLPTDGDYGLSTSFTSIMPASLGTDMVFETPLNLLSPSSMYHRYLNAGGVDMCAKENAVPEVLAGVCEREAARRRERIRLARGSVFDGHFERDLKLVSRDLQISHYQNDEDLLQICKLSQFSTDTAVGLRKVGFSGLVNIIVTMRQYVTFSGQFETLDQSLKQFAAGPHGPLYIVLHKKVAGWVTPSAWKAIVLPTTFKLLLIRVLREAIKANILQAELEGSQITFGNKPEFPQWVKVCLHAGGCGPRQPPDNRPRVRIMDFSEYRRVLEGEIANP